MDETITLLSKVLDLTTARHRVLAHNLANVNTPGYQRQDMRFKDALLSAIESQTPGQISQVRGEMFVDGAPPSRPDGNNVSAQTELAEMSQNEFLYQVSTKALNKKYGLLKRAIKGQ